VGQAVCRSGRTEGWSCGSIDEVGIYVVRGPSGEPDDLRSFNGFLSTSVQSRGGDSGGPWISGNYAVGTHSAGNPRTSAQNFAVAATLQDSLTVVPGIQLRLFLNQPVLAGSLPAGPIAAGQRISGRIPAAPAAHVPAGSSVRITVPGQEPVDVPVDANGNWSFTAHVSTTQVSAQTLNGFSRSGISTFRTGGAGARAVQPCRHGRAGWLQARRSEAGTCPAGDTGSPYTGARTVGRGRETGRGHQFLGKADGGRRAGGHGGLGAAAGCRHCRGGADSWQLAAGGSQTPRQALGKTEKPRSAGQAGGGPEPACAPAPPLSQSRPR
jgi:hypothetical protein